MGHTALQVAAVAAVAAVLLIHRQWGLALQGLMDSAGVVAEAPLITAMVERGDGEETAS